MHLPPIPSPDAEARRAAIARYDDLAVPTGALGRLAELGCWLAAAQGTCPPRRPPGRGWSSWPPTTASPPRASRPTRRTSRARRVVSAARAQHARRGARARRRGVAAGRRRGRRPLPRRPGPGQPARPRPSLPRRRRHGPHRPDGRADRRRDRARRRRRAGRSPTTRSTPAPTCWCPARSGSAPPRPASVLVAAITGAEPVAVVGRGSGIDDEAWMRKAAAIRDALRRARPHARDPLALLRVAGGADLAVLTGFLRSRPRCAGRRCCSTASSPVAAALVADELAPGARDWWLLAQRSPEPALALAAEHLELTPLLDLHVRLDDGSGAVAVVPLLRWPRGCSRRPPPDRTAGSSRTRAWGCERACGSPFAHRELHGLLLALSWLTVLPVRVAGADVGRAAAGALRWAPVVGALLGAARARCWSAWQRSGCRPPGCSPSGSWRSPPAACTSTGWPTPPTAWAATARPERALAVMREGGVGAFAVVTLVVVARGAGRGADRSWPRDPVVAVAAIGPGGGDRPGRVRLVRPPRGPRRPAGRAGRDGGGLAAGVGRRRCGGWRWPWPGSRWCRAARGRARWPSRWPRRVVVALSRAHPPPLRRGDRRRAGRRERARRHRRPRRARRRSPDRQSVLTLSDPAVARTPRGDARARSGGRRACASRSGCPAPCRAGCR